jgi:hypothetical protein
MPPLINAWPRTSPWFATGRYRSGASFKVAARSKEPENGFKVAVATKTDALGNLIITAPAENRPTVLLFHQDVEKIARWSKSIDGRCDVRHASTSEELDAVVASEQIDVVVADSYDGLLERLSQLDGLHLIHCSATVQESLLEATARGVEIAHVDDELQLAERIFKLTFPRSAMARHRVRGNLDVSWIGATAQFRLVDISNDGFAFSVEAEQALDAMLPGAVLEGVEIRTPRGVALSGGAAVVRHVEVAADGSPFYWVGCELRPARTPPAEQITVIQDRALVAGLLRNALRTGGIVVGAVDAMDSEIQCGRGDLDAQRGEISLPGATSFPAHSVLRGRFELGGSVYRFFTSVIHAAPLTLSAPTRLEAIQQRGSTRYLPPMSAPVQVDLSSILAGASAIRNVRDLSSTGFSLDIDPLTDLCPPGTVFHRVVIRISGQEFVCRGRVKNLTRLAGSKEARCGVVFQDMDESTRVRLADRIVASRYPGLSDGCRVPFDDLWRFFLDTRFIYPEKQANLAPLIPEIQRTIESLNARPTKLFKSVVALDGGRIVGHISSLRVYDRSWMSQHLAASVGRHAGSLLNFGQVEVFEQNPDLEYFKAFFRPDNRWPARVFGAFAKTIKDARLSDLRSFSYFTIPITFSIVAPGDIEVVECSEDELSVVERYFVQRERGLLLRSDNLTRRALTLSDLNAAYKKLGLQRRRRVLLAWRKGVPLGFALVEISSPGLNFSEILSAFRLFVLPEGESSARHVRISLLSSVLAIYRQAGRPAAVGLAPFEERAQWELLGLETHKIYTAWTCHRALLQRFSDHVDRLIRAITRKPRDTDAQVTL